MRAKVLNESHLRKQKGEIKEIAKTNQNCNTHKTINKAQTASEPSPNPQATKAKLYATKPI